MSNTGSAAAEGRTARMERTTSESSVLVEINLDGTGVSDISTSVPFYDHMLTALSKHSLIDMTVKATGDTHIDVHHTVEDVAITFGEVLRTALGTRPESAASGKPPFPSTRPSRTPSSMSPAARTSCTAGSLPARNTT